MKVAATSLSWIPLSSTFCHSVSALASTDFHVWVMLLAIRRAGATCNRLVNCWEFVEVNMEDVLSFSAAVGRSSEFVVDRAR